MHKISKMYKYILIHSLFKKNENNSPYFSPVKYNQTDQHRKHAKRFFEGESLSNFSDSLDMLCILKIRFPQSKKNPLVYMS